MRGYSSHPPTIIRSGEASCCPAWEQRQRVCLGSLRLQVFPERMARGRVASRQGQGPSLLFGKALWPALDIDRRWHRSGEGVQ